MIRHHRLFQETKSSILILSTHQQVLIITSSKKITQQFISTFEAEQTINKLKISLALLELW